MGIAPMLTVPSRSPALVRLHGLRVRLKASVARPRASHGIGPKVLFPRREQMFKGTRNKRDTS